MRRRSRRARGRGTSGWPHNPSKKPSASEMCCQVSLEDVFSKKRESGRTKSRLLQVGARLPHSAQHKPHRQAALSAAFKTHLRHVVEGGARQAKVADLELAVRVGQDVLGLEVAVEHLGGNGPNELCGVATRCTNPGTQCVCCTCTGKRPTATQLPTLLRCAELPRPPKVAATPCP